jgi:tryptophan synthase beta subunit
LHGAKRWAKENPGKTAILCMSGRGDKDMPTLQRTLLAGNASSTSVHAGAKP